MPGRTVLQIDPTRVHSRHSEGAFVTLQDGRILFIYSRYKQARHDNDAAELVARESRDGGRTWNSRDRVIVRHEMGGNVMSVSLLRLVDGRIALFYLRKDVLGMKARGVAFGPVITCVPMLRYSEDEGRTFSDPIQIVPVPGYFVLNNDRVVQLASGRLVVPLALHAHLPDRGGSSLNGQPALTERPAAVITYYYSDDAGQTWHESQSRLIQDFSNGMGMQEPGLIELQNGRLWSWMRTDEGADAPRGISRQWQSVSHDLGVTWEPLRPSRFYSPCSPMSVKRIPGTRHLLALWNDRDPGRELPTPTHGTWQRTPLAAAISENDGRTWPHYTLVESSPRRGFCYTAIHFTDDGHVLLAYCAGGETTPSVLDTLRIKRVRLTSLY